MAEASFSEIIVFCAGINPCPSKGLFSEGLNSIVMAIQLVRKPIRPLAVMILINEDVSELTS